MMRPKRSHHCSRCGHCVRRMDHHCPWINNCVGEDNHWLFLQLCFYTQLLSAYTLLLDFCHYYYFQPLHIVNWDLFVFKHELALLRISTFMGIIMFIGMCGLFYTQIIGLLTVLKQTSWFSIQLSCSSVFGIVSGKFFIAGISFSLFPLKIVTEVIQCFFSFFKNT
ncbi:palmitoyltransferase ZDHHC21 isoform X2 [Rhinatrema bivittatum]|nr:palmitoyltransferase ZDHHC21 isoform X2 [Rhinatrema bivittatum]